MGVIGRLCRRREDIGVCVERVVEDVVVGVEDVEDSVLVGYSDFIKKMYFLKSVMSKLLLMLASIL